LVSEKYSEVKWFSKDEMTAKKNICPLVIAAFLKAHNYLEQGHYKDKYQRSLADYQNLIKQSAQEKTEFIKYANGRLLEELLPVYDHLKLSLLNLPETEIKNAWVIGVQHVLKQFKDLLSTEGVDEIVTVNQPFDLNTMEAIEGEGDLVIKEVMPGYKLNGRLMRAAKVIVGQKQSKKSEI
ncbi:MAG: nucleotide exchange factor GrpE, partial [Patescibacteria group bacterium]